MAKLNLDEYPRLRASEDRPVNVIESLDALKGTGVSFASYGFINPGEVIEFPALADMQIVEQAIGNGSTAKQILVGCKRNGENSWFSLGALTRMDAEKRQGVCDFTKEMIALNDNFDRVPKLAGRKITWTEMVPAKLQAFNDARRPIRGQYVEGELPIVTYAN